MATVDEELTRMGHQVRAAATTLSSEPRSAPSRQRGQMRIVTRVLAFAAVALVVVGGPLLFLRSDSALRPTDPSTGPSVVSTVTSGDTTEPPPSTVLAPAQPHLWYLLEDPGWELLTANAGKADVGIVNVRYSTDPSSAFGNRASLTAVTDPAQMSSDMSELLSQASLSIEDGQTESIVVGDKTVELVTFPDNFHYAMWTGPTGEGVALYAAPGIGADYNGPTRDEFINLIDGTVAVSRETWEAAAANLLPELPPNPAESDWIRATDQLSLAVLRPDDGTIAVWSQVSETGDAQVEFYGDHTNFTGFVAVRMGGTSTLIAAVDPDEAYTGAVWVFLADGEQIGASIEFDSALGLGITLIEHAADAEVIQVVPEGTPTG